MEITCKNQRCKKEFEVPHEEIVDAYNLGFMFDHLPVEIQALTLMASGCDTVFEYKAKTRKHEIALLCPHCNKKNDYALNDFGTSKVIKPGLNSIKSIQNMDLVRGRRE